MKVRVPPLLSVIYRSSAQDRDFFVPDPTGWTMLHLVLRALSAPARKQLCGAPAAPAALLLRVLGGSPVNRKRFISPLTHPAVRTSWGQRSLTSPQRHPVPSCHRGPMWPLPCCAAPRLVPAGGFLHSTRTFGVCWPGPQHRGCFSRAIYSWDTSAVGVQKDFLVLLAFTILCGSVTRA